MPKTSNSNRLVADYVSQAGLTKVYIGVQAQSKDMVSVHQKEDLGPNSPETWLNDEKQECSLF